MMQRESTNAQDARVEELWSKLNATGKGHLDLEGLKEGLKRMDHPLKNADTLLKDVLDAIDENKDGLISYTEFRSFVRQTESELRQLFETIDHNQDGKLDKKELYSAFAKAGMDMPASKFERFFAHVDSNSDGVVSFDEWRDFLLFIPATEPNLRAVLSYYSATVKLNPEGDVNISDEALQGLGTLLAFLKPFFSSIILIATTSHPTTSSHDFESFSKYLYDVDIDMSDSEDPEMEPQEPLTFTWTSISQLLIACVPSAGYFIAGGLAGIISRTTTAPLDRLKVYLIAQTGATRDTVQAAKSGNVLQALRSAGLSLWLSMKDLWAAGGMRSLFAGNGINIVKIVPESAIKFGSYEAAKRFIAKFEGGDKTQHSSVAKYIAGGFSGMVSQFFIYPLDTLKFRMQCDTVSGGLHGNKLILATARKMWLREGVRAYYRGLQMGLIGVFPYAAIDLGTFEYLKRRVTLRNMKKYGMNEKDAHPGSFATALMGGCSGALGASMVYPLNLLRTRLQSQGTAHHPRTYTGIRDVFQQTLKGEGIRGLFKGLTPNLLKVVPAVSITWVVYEKSKQHLGLN
ncbi:calcium dependent mitochondrial carrier protein [Trichodelitschia bisporula]|uniref:Mitochondrial thiamine pyrophosphate carrier 1 n=1 Tax=Trichodelitschia bisporula TaxID=703511 RepID=A0A6G1I019_9PEZI|nr:calcium dependent mitochondrial carrier protein [Trichodelitschia bisporula]